MSELTPVPLRAWRTGDRTFELDKVGAIWRVSESEPYERPYYWYYSNLHSARNWLASLLVKARWGDGWGCYDGNMFGRLKQLTWDGKQWKPVR